MGLTYGFYDSFGHDRQYNSVQMSEIFDGIIDDGVYEKIGNCLRVTPGIGLSVVVGSGRAWFDHTWNLNDAPIVLTIETPSLVSPRYDAVVLEINSDPSVRENTIKIVKGDPLNTPLWPTLTNTALVHQHPLAYIYVAVGATSFSSVLITNTVGTVYCPFVVGAVQSLDINFLITTWGSFWTGAQTALFTAWFDAIKGQLSTDAAGNLQLQMNDRVASEQNLQGQINVANHSLDDRIAAEQSLQGQINNNAAGDVDQQHQLDDRVLAEQSLQTQINTLHNNSRNVLTADHDYYVRTDGNDTHTGEINTAAGAFLTIQKAIDTACALDMRSYSVIIHVGDGTYSTPVILKSYLGYNNIKIIGNESVPDSVIISALNADQHCFSTEGFGGDYVLRGVKMQAAGTHGDAIRVSSHFHVYVGNVDFGACPYGNHIHAVNGGQITVIDPGYVVSGTCENHIMSENNSIVDMKSVTLTFPVSNINMSSFLFIKGNSLVSMIYITFVNPSRVIGIKYGVVMNSVLNTNTGHPETYIPGSSAGSLSTGGESD